MKFSEIVKQKRLALGLSQKQLAEAAGVSLRSVCNYEAGSREPGSMGIVKSLSAVLGCSARELLGEGGEYVIGARKKGGARAAKEVSSLLSEIGGLFAGGEVSEEDKDKIMRVINDMYWQAKDNNKKYTPKKYKKTDD